jgi:catechol 2,3-dioxygenase-like lactoylglutathione lyase family enzyme
MFKFKLPEIGHIGYIVSDMDSSVKAFETIYRASFSVYNFVPLRSWAFGKEIFDCKMRIGMGVVDNGMKLELILPISGDTPQMRFMKDYCSGMHHIAHYVKNYDEYLNYYKNIKDVQIIFEAEVSDEIRGYRRCFYAQQDELLPIIEFTEIAKV